MKRLVCLLFVAALVVALCACENNKTNENVEKAQAAINALSEAEEYMMEIDTQRWLSDNSYSSVYFYDSLYVDEHAEIHHNEWSLAYEEAMEAYNSLSTEEKTLIENSACLDYKYYVDEYKSVLLEQEIALFCKDFAVEDLKEKLINKSSYEEYDWILEEVFYSENAHSFGVELKIEYSATNKFGGRIDDIEYFRCSGTYKNGIITIDYVH